MLSCIAICLFCSDIACSRSNCCSSSSSSSSMRSRVDFFFFGCWGIFSSPPPLDVNDDGVPFCRVSPSSSSSMSFPGKSSSARAEKLRKVHRAQHHHVVIETNATIPACRRATRRPSRLLWVWWSLPLVDVSSSSSVWCWSKPTSSNPVRHDDDDGRLLLLLPRFLSILFPKSVRREVGGGVLLRVV